MCRGEEGEAGEAVVGDAGAARWKHGAQGLQTGVQRSLWDAKVPPPVRLCAAETPGGAVVLPFPPQPRSKAPVLEEEEEKGEDQSSSLLNLGGGTSVAPWLQ